MKSEFKKLVAENTKAAESTTRRLKDEELRLERIREELMQESQILDKKHFEVIIINHSYIYTHIYMCVYSVD
jgi:hypothetical protein